MNYATRLQRFDHVLYKKRSELYLADTLSRAFLQKTGNASDVSEEEIWCENQRKKQMKKLKGLIWLTAYQCLYLLKGVIRRAMESDIVMKALNRGQ